MHALILVTLLVFFRKNADPPAEHVHQSAPEHIVEDFEAYQPGDLPTGWMILRDRELVPLDPVFMAENEKFYVVQEKQNKFIRAYTQGEAQQIMLRVDGASGIDWDLQAFPTLSWEWRALRLPVGAREDKVNDTGAAVYVTFDRKDWLGRPHSIKYTFSSTLPVGEVVSTGSVKVLVVASGLDGTGQWKHVLRNVAEDYRRLFKKDPPRPLTITLWSDSDNTKTISEADFDNIAFMPAQ